MAFSFTGYRSMQCAVMVLLFIAATPVRAEDFALTSAGVQFGLPASHGGKDFWSTEAITRWNLPWDWRFGTNWSLNSRLELTAGWLGDGHQNAFISSCGPSFGLHRARLPLAVEAGVSPTVITHHDFQSKDFGSFFQFTSHIGLSCQIVSHFVIAYQIQHMSNAGIAQPNPGLNLHVIELRYIF